MNKKLLKRISITLLSLICMLGIVVGGYIVYMNETYYRIEDNISLDINNNQNNILNANNEYSAVTYNIGFGAYDKDYSFFMDKGVMEDGKKVKGKFSRGTSKSKVLENTNGSINLIKSLDTDFILLQEVDIKANRSYNLNQVKEINRKLNNYGSAFALNFHAPYMIYPLNKPHGSVQAGLMTLSKYKFDSSKRISYPVDTSFVSKFFDLDRCFSSNRYKVSNGKELVIINSHMSAYDDGNIRTQQLKVLNNYISNEYSKGNYVLIGGDFNHSLNIESDTFKSKQLVPDWVQSLTDDDLPKGFKIVNAYNNTKVATCRSADIPYKKGVNYLAVLDGFIVSDNIESSVENIDGEFEYSDHNPVKITFKLK